MVDSVSDNSAADNESFSIEHNDGPSRLSDWSEIKRLIRPLASMKLAVVSFVCSLILVLAGTLAQVESDIWEVVDQYFRCWYTFLPVRVFAPLFAPYLDLSGVDPRRGMFFPGGFTIGAMMSVNLIAAFIVRFTIRARGVRLLAGVGLTLLGSLATWAVIAAGNDTNSNSGTMIEYETLWTAFQAMTVLLLVGSVAAIAHYWNSNRPLANSLIGPAVILLATTLFIFTYADSIVDDSGMRILWQLLKAEFAALILLPGFCLLYGGKRGPVVLIHAGIVLMMANEVVVYGLHTETQMTLEEGETGYFGRDIRTFELALVNSSHDDYDDEAVISKAALLKAVSPGDEVLVSKPARQTADDPRADNAVISDEVLPCDVEVVRLIQNSNPLDRREFLMNIGMQLGIPPITVSEESVLDALQPDRKTVDEMLDNVVQQFALKLTDDERAGIKKVSDLTSLVFETQNPATEGPGRNMVAAAVRATTGTDAGGEVDLTSAYVRLIDKQTRKPLGTYLVGVYFQMTGQNTTVQIGEDTWDLSLRFGRHYKPYNVTLLDVSKKDYIGTSTPRDYRSRVQVTDVGTGSEFETDIWMNNPLRFSGDTFYQSNYSPATRFRKETTTLAVVTNTGWLIPYISCMIVGTGLLGHFWVSTIRFLRRRQAEATTGNGQSSRIFNILTGGDSVSEPDQDTIESSLFARAVPWFVAILVAGYFLGKMRTPDSGEFKIHEFGRIPIVYEGRVQPIDTLARNSLRMISNRTTYYDAHGDRTPAIQWLLHVLAGSEKAFDLRVFRVDNPELLAALKLERREKHLYSVSDLRAVIPELVKMSQGARRKEQDDLTALERRVLDLERKLGHVNLLMMAFSPIPIGEGDNWLQELQQAREQLNQLEQQHPPLLVPPVPAKDGAKDAPEPGWETLAAGLTKAQVQVQFLNASPDRPVELLAQIVSAFAAEKPEDFNKHVSEYHEWFAENTPADANLARVDFESFYNQFSPAYYASFTYLFAFVFSALALLGWSRPLERCAFMTILVTFCIHTFVLVARIYISGRPPVTNLYSSAVFIGWGCVIFGMMLESIYRIGVGNVMASVLGAMTLGVAYQLSGDGDTFKVLQAVLDTQFWLATHVVCVTLGYSATLLSGSLGAYFVISGMLTTRLDAERRRDMVRMIYGTVAFGVFFSFVGTVLGGLWADDSWGRFWGWDPKENGALMIVLWNALVLHARWDRIVDDRGFAVLVIGGNIITSWSWFGVNELGVGLHSYGFSEGRWAWLWAYWVSQLFLMAVAQVPTTLWACYRDRDVPA